MWATASSKADFALILAHIEHDRGSIYKFLDLVLQKHPDKKILLADFSSLYHWHVGHATPSIRRDLAVKLLAGNENDLKIPAIQLLSDILELFFKPLSPLARSHFTFVLQTEGSAAQTLLKQSARPTVANVVPGDADASVTFMPLTEADKIVRAHRADLMERAWTAAFDAFARQNPDLALRCITVDKMTENDNTLTAAVLSGSEVLGLSSDRDNLIGLLASLHAKNGDFVRVYHGHALVGYCDPPSACAKYLQQAQSKTKELAKVTAQLPLAREALKALEAAAAGSAPGVSEIFRHFFSLPFACCGIFPPFTDTPSQSAAAAPPLDAAALQKQRVVKKKQLAAASSAFNGLDGLVNNLTNEVC
jgi:hypothetical protein